MKLLITLSIVIFCASCGGDSSKQEAVMFPESTESDLELDQENAAFEINDSLTDGDLVVEDELSYIDSVYLWMDSAESKFNKAPFIQTYGHEKWSYNRINENLEIVFITYQKNGFVYTEEFILFDSELIYAIEWEEFAPDTDDAMTWNCEYYIRQGEIIHYSSLGHGETETDEWEPESIFKQWNAHGNNWVDIKQKF
jgi:hypothetical protein